MEDMQSQSKPSIVFQETDGKLKAKQEYFLLSEVMMMMVLVVVAATATTTTTMTMITLCGQIFVFLIKFCKGENRRHVHTCFAWSRDERFSFL
jgi:hypothetical protein